MADLPARDLRNDVSAVLRRVEAGEQIRVTVSGRPVANLMPLAGKPDSILWEQLMETLQNARADTALTQELKDILPDTTDDAAI